MKVNGGWAAVLFDLDGTLADTVELILRCYRHTMRTHLGRELPDEPPSGLPCGISFETSLGTTTRPPSCWTRT